MAQLGYDDYTKPLIKAITVSPRALLINEHRTLIFQILRF